MAEQWYEPDEMREQAKGAKMQPEFDPPEIVLTEEHVDEFLQPVVADYTAWKAEFDANYVPPPNN